jgi:two-component system, NarL family, response regulator NreC
MRQSGGPRNRKQGPQFTGGLPAHCNMTARELEVLEKLAQGMTTKQIARELKMSVKRASTHRCHLLNKFDVSNTVLPVRRAIARRDIQA